MSHEIKSLKEQLAASEEDRARLRGAIIAHNGHEYCECGCENCEGCAADSMMRAHLGAVLDSPEPRMLTMGQLPFYLEMRGDVWVRQDRAGGCAPATDSEILLAKQNEHVLQELKAAREALGDMHDLVGFSQPEQFQKHQRAEERLKKTIKALRRLDAFLKEFK